MTEKDKPSDQEVPNCENCAIRKKAEERPKSLAGRFWRWHIKWCPGWKSYQAFLAEQGT
jgi:hypothetical protein